MCIYRILIMSGHVVGWAFDWAKSKSHSLVIEGPTILVGSVLGLSSSHSICSSWRLRSFTIDCSLYMIIVCVLKGLCRQISWL